MTKNKSKPCKPDKPYAGFPLTAHPNGQWCKKIRGKVHFFGVWAEPMEALENYNRQAADLHAGRQPRPRSSSDYPTIKDLANAYLATQRKKAERGLITASWFRDCLDIAKAFTNFIGKDRLWNDLRPDDFASYRMYLYDNYGVCAIDRTMTVVKAIFKHAYDLDLIDRPIKYGGQFNKPSAKEKRRDRSKRDRANGKRLFTATQIRKLIDNADNELKAMIVLGINGGFGNTDCAELPVAAINFKEAIIEYERPKTAVMRIVPLWPETVAALKAVLAKRPKPKKEEYAHLVFLTKYGNPWKREIITSDNGENETQARKVQAISAELSKLLKRLRFKRLGLGFYAFRHTFRTWADETNDQHAIHRIMGHTIPGMSGIYVEEISLDRLRAVVNHVRSKLWPNQ